MAAQKSGIMTRFFFITLLAALTGLAVLVKAGIIMFAERDYWKGVADRFVKEGVPLKPNRGNILSADGQLMASSLPEYRIYMDFKAGGSRKDSLLMVHMDEICRGLHRIFPDKSAAYFRRRLTNGRKRESRNWLIYPNRISYSAYKQVKQLPVFNLNKYRGGFHEQAYNLRKKPFGSLAARTLGDLYADTAKGAKNGIELAFDTLLKGRDGVVHRQKVMNRYVSIVDRQPVDGCDILTTLDVDMQDICEKALIDKMKEIGAQSGVVVLMEVKTGDVKAIVNMTRAANGRYYEMRNNAISDMLEPGSTFKTASIMVALEDGLITPHTTVDTGNGVKNMHGRKMRDHNWLRGGYGTIDVTRIMETSSNIGVSSLIDRHYGDDPQRFVDGLKRMGLTLPLNLQIPGEGVPNIKGPDDQKTYFDKTALPWMSIGYRTQLPPINTLTFYNAIANDGTMVKPRFVKAALKDGEVVKEFPTEVLVPQICSNRTLGQIREILERVVNHGLGMPAGSEQFPVAGKTGTAQVSQGALGYKTSEGTQYLVSFCGYFPADKPLYSCIVAIRKTGLPASGGLMAGKVFARIAERIYAGTLRIDPTIHTDPKNFPLPDVKAGHLPDAERVLAGLNLPVRSEGKRVIESAPWGTTHHTDNAVKLRSVSPATASTVPNVKGMGARDAVYLLDSQGFKPRVRGKGRVKEQITRGKEVTLILQ